MSLVLGALLLLRVGGPASLRRQVDPPALVLQIQQLSELSTVKYRVQKVVGLEEKKFPAGSERILLVVDATVHAGVDLSQLRAAQLRILGKDRIAVELPQARILNVVIDEKQTRVWDRSVTWWTPWVPYNPDLERQARLAAIEAVREAALEMGILEQARANARQTIRTLAGQFGLTTVEFSNPLS